MRVCVCVCVFSVLEMVLPCQHVDRLKSPTEDLTTTIPTIGFNVETLQYKNIKFQVWDLGGQTSIRPYWRCYYPNTDAIIFVVDSTDVDRFDIAKRELWAMLEVQTAKLNNQSPIWVNEQSPSNCSNHLNNAVLHV